MKQLAKYTKAFSKLEDKVMISESEDEDGSLGLRSD